MASGTGLVSEVKCNCRKTNKQLRDEQTNKIRDKQTKATATTKRIVKYKQRQNTIIPEINAVILLIFFYENLLLIQTLIAGHFAGCIKTKTKFN